MEQTEDGILSRAHMGIYFSCWTSQMNTKNISSNLCYILKFKLKFRKNAKTSVLQVLSWILALKSALQSVQWFNIQLQNSDLQIKIKKKRSSL